MGMYAEILAIGPFSEKLAAHLAFPSDYYNGTRDGTPVIVELFGMCGTSASREFALHLGIDEAWDFNQHAIDPQKINFKGLAEQFRLRADGDKLAADLQSLQVLIANGFKLIFMPNG